MEANISILHRLVHPPLICPSYPTLRSDAALGSSVWRYESPRRGLRLSLSATLSTRLNVSIGVLCSILYCLFVNKSELNLSYRQKNSELSYICVGLYTQECNQKCTLVC